MLLGLSEILSNKKIILGSCIFVSPLNYIRIKTKIRITYKLSETFLEILFSSRESNLKLVQVILKKILIKINILTQRNM